MICLWCGSTFKPFVTGLESRFCSSWCGNMHVLLECSQRLPERFLKGMRGSSKVRRSAIRNGEFILVGAVYESFNWKCHVCKNSINIKLKHPHPLAGTIDHLKELGNGGLHVWSNLAPAHAVCNWNRSNGS